MFSRLRGIGAKNAKSDSSNESDHLIYRQRTESLLFLGIGSLIWWLIVWQSLKWLQFPYHLHQMEICLVCIVPVLFMYIMIKLIDNFL